MLALRVAVINKMEHGSNGSDQKNGKSLPFHAEGLDFDMFWGFVHLLRHRPTTRGWERSQRQDLFDVWRIESFPESLKATSSELKNLSVKLRGLFRILPFPSRFSD